MIRHDRPEAQCRRPTAKGRRERNHKGGDECRQQYLVEWQP